jgi:hypothetical protein
MLAALASQAAVTIENGKFFLATVQKNMELLETKQQLERKVRELDVLMEIAQVAASAQRLDDLLEGVLQRACAPSTPRRARSSSPIGRPETCASARRSAARRDKVKRMRIPRGQGICGWVTRNRQPKVVHDVSRRHAPHHRHRRSRRLPPALGARGAALLGRGRVEPERREPGRRRARAAQQGQGSRSLQRRRRALRDAHRRADLDGHPARGGARAAEPRGSPLGHRAAALERAARSEDADGRHRWATRASSSRSPSGRCASASRARSSSRWSSSTR